MNRQYKNKFKNLLKQNNCEMMEIAYILERKINDRVYVAKAVAYDPANCDSIVEMNIDGEGTSSFQNLAYWDYNIDSYFLEDLESGYDIKYMTIYEHYNTWCAIDAWKDEIDHQVGLQNYLSYCQRNNVSAHSIALVGSDSVDIMPLYQEKNCQYKIIASVDCNDQSVVLGFNEMNIQPYVTWETTSNRKGGYYCGHYYSIFKEAYKDFEERSHKIVSKELTKVKLKCKPIEKKEMER